MSILKGLSRYPFPKPPVTIFQTFSCRISDHPAQPLAVAHESMYKCTAGQLSVHTMDNQMHLHREPFSPAFRDTCEQGCDFSAVRVTCGSEFVSRQGGHTGGVRVPGIWVSYPYVPVPSGHYQVQSLTYHFYLIVASCCPWPTSGFGELVNIQFITGTTSGTE